MARYVAVLFAAGVFVAARVAQAQPTVWLDMTHCPDLDEAEVQRIFAADLGYHLRVANEGNATRVVVTCRNSRIALRVLDPLSRKLTARTIEVSLADERAQARLVAIAAAELVLATWAELEVNPTPRVEPEGARPEPGATRSAREVVREHRTLDRARGPSGKKTEEEELARVMRGLAVVSTRGFWQYEGRLWGGGIRFGDDRLDFLSWTADALFEQGSITTSAGAVELSTATLGGTLYFFRRWRWLTGRAGAGLRPGVTTSDGTTTVSPWGWPMLAASLSVQPFDRLVFEVAGEAGHAVLPVSAQGVDVTAVRGFWASLQLGVGLAF